MVVEVVELEAGREVRSLAASLERSGGALVVMRWRRDEPTLATLFLPDDENRRATCRELVDAWRSAPPTSEVCTEGYAWPLGHPRHQLDLGMR